MLRVFPHTLERRPTRGTVGTGRLLGVTQAKHLSQESPGASSCQAETHISEKEVKILAGQALGRL